MENTFKKNEEQKKEELNYTKFSDTFFKDRLE